TVRADEVHDARLQVGLGEGEPYGVLEATAFRVGRGDVRGVTGGGVAQEPPQPAARRLVAGHEDERGRLTEQQPAAPSIEWPDAIARQRPQSVESPHDEAAEHVIATGPAEVG